MKVSDWIRRVSRSRYKKDTSGELTFQTSFVARKISRDGTESIRTKDSSGRSSEADVDRDGHVTGAIQGRAPRGEEGGLAVATTLVDYLNQQAKVWGPPQLDDQPERGVDWVSEAEGDRLLIQVTRIPDSATWRRLASAGTAHSEHSAADAASQLRMAIKGKATIEPQLRRAIALAIDAVMMPALATSPIVAAFRTAHGRYVDSLAFRSVWVVGPVVGTVHRLDGGDEPTRCLTTR